LFRQRKLAPSSVTQRLAALRFFFIKTLKRRWSVAETPYPKQARHLPTVLSQEEVARLINAAPTPFYRILLMTLYATGARRAELARLKVSDIDSQRMVVHIQGGKGRQDRDVMLSPVLLEALREYGRGLKPKTWLFPGSRAHTALPPVAFRDIRSSRGLRSIRPTVDSAVQVHEPTLQPRLILLPRQAVYPRCGFPHTHKPLGHACVGCVFGWSVFALISGLPSPSSADALPSLFEWFIGTMPLSDSSQACIRAVRPKPSPVGLFLAQAPPRSPGSRAASV
jgi:hypothetical protein